MNNLPVALSWPSECTSFKRLGFAAKEHADESPLTAAGKKSNTFGPKQIAKILRRGLPTVVNVGQGY
jgi:hypothetical protein